MVAILSKIVEARKSKGLTQNDICEKIGIARNNYSKIETGKTELTVNHLIKIAGALSVSVVSLIDPGAQSKDYFKELNAKIESLEEQLNDKRQIIDFLSDRSDGLKEFAWEIYSNELKEGSEVPKNRLNREDFIRYHAIEYLIKYRNEGRILSFRADSFDDLR
jgi:transcriptional regulator with XRE-family HTH domain